VRLTFKTEDSLLDNLGKRRRERKMEWLPETCPGLTVNIQSIAGVATTVCVKRHKELNIMFDVGQHVNLPDGAVSHVFVSHGHLDHIGAMFSLARRHGFGPKHPIFVVPEVCMEPVLKAKAAFEVGSAWAIHMHVCSLA
jgi:glyoxylase-like metal-dependent hydrolase (beta-lactamase superfamily II)